MNLNIEKQPLTKVSNRGTGALYHQIVEYIRLWIREGKLKEGDMLPSERELTKIFDVSRVPVREALKSLEFMGIVEQVRGKGVFVKKINITQVLNNVDFMIDKKIHTLLDLFEAREAIELYAVRLAAERRTNEDIVQMELALLETRENIILKKSIVDVSVKFHTAMIKATHNDVLIRINYFLNDLLSYSREQSHKDIKRHKEVLKFHTNILKCIKAKDANAASEVLAEHLRLGKEVIISDCNNTI